MFDNFSGTYEISKHITTRFIGDEAFLMNLENLKTYYLNETAAQVWLLIDGAHTFDEIVNSLLENYEISHVECMSDVTKLIYALMNERCIPYGVNLELTARCNLDCRHCYHVVTSGPEMETAEVIHLLDDCARLGTMELTLTGGEPLIREDLKEIIVHAVESAGFSVKLFSNLTLLEPSIIDVLASIPLNAVETSLLGPNAGTHDELTGLTGSFDATINAIVLLKKRGIRVSAKTVLMKQNAKNLEEMYRLADKLGISLRHDDALFIESDGGRGPLALQIPDREVIRTRKIYGSDVPFVPSSCNAGRSVMSISPDGSVYPCGAFNRAAGNIRETPLETIWYESPLMKKFRSFKDEDYRVCSDCRYVVRCQGCVAMGIGIAYGRTYPCRFARTHFRHLT